MPEYTIELIAVGCGDLFSSAARKPRTTMNQQLQRTAIAKARGWKVNSPTATTGWQYPHSSSAWFLPDYLGDLNSCNDLVDELGRQGWSCVLVAENGKRCCTFVKGDVEHKVITTKFEDSICESFLRVLGLWEPTATNKEENANVDLPDTAAQDSASKSNNPAVSG